MSRYVFKMPDLGEGTVEAEIVDWHVQPGDRVVEDQTIVDVMTEKATVEVSAPVSGRVVSITGAPGDRVRVGTDLIVFETQEDASAATGEDVPFVSQAVQAREPAAAPSSVTAVPAAAVQGAPAAAPESGRGRVMTSPAIRRRAREAGVRLEAVPGTGPGGRITREDFQSFVERRHAPAPARGAALAETPAAEEIKVIGLRRVIAQRMSEAKRTIPHFAYVEELDVTELESLRAHLNGRRPEGAPALTYLPFIVCALVRVLQDFPQCNAWYDAERNVLVRHRVVHVGIATQTPDGLKVPVVRHAERRSLWDLAREIARVSQAARDSTAPRDALRGSTITVTSLGKLGGIASTPVINPPEVAIVGVNRALERPVVHGGAIAVRRMMNLSSSFDHRFVDGYDAAAMIQAVKEHLEHPATLFITA